jgi:hypothetical protein
MRSTWFASAIPPECEPATDVRPEVRTPKSSPQGLSSCIRAKSGEVSENSVGDEPVELPDIDPLAQIDLDVTGPVQSSSSALKSSNLPAFSEDHMLIDEYGNE